MAVILAVLATCGSTALAANGTWSGSTNGSWSVGTNWSGSVIPGATNSTTNGDTATFNSTATNSTLTIDANRNIGSLLFTTASSASFAYTIGDSGVNAGNTLLLSSGGSISITGTTNGNQTINAPLSIQSASGSYTFTNSSAGTGLLFVNGNVSAAAAGASVLNLAGTQTGTNTVSGTISNGSATTLSVSKSGAGQWVLAGNNTYTGSTSVTAGTLTLGGASGSILSTSSITVAQGATFRLDNSTSSNTDRVSDTLGIALNGGSLTFSVNTAAGSFSETLGALNLGGGLSTVTTGQATSGQTSTLTFASLNRPAGAGINFAGTGLGSNTQNRVLFTSAPTVTNGIIGPWATYAGSDYATYGANGVAIASYTDISALGSTIANGSSTNVRLNSATGSGNITLGSATTSINTLLQNTNTAATVDTASKTLRAAGIMVGAGTKNTLKIGVNAGEGTVTALTDGGELVLNGNNTNALTVNAVIADNGSASSVTKIGGNSVILAGNNTYTGTTTVAQGTLQLGNAGTTGSITGPVAIYTGATLASSRTDASSPVAGGIIGLGGGITVNSGTLTVRPLAGSNSFGTLTLGNNTRLVVNGDATSTNSFSNVPSPATGSRLEFAGGNNTLPGSWFQSSGKDNQAWYFTGGTTSLNTNNIIAYGSIYGYGLVADGARLNSNQTGVGWGANSIGVLDITGTFGAGAGGGGLGLYFGSASGAVGVFNQSRGAVVTTNAGTVQVGSAAGGRGELNISGGTFGSAGGSSGNNAYNLTITANATATGLVNLTGGSLTIRSVNTASNASGAYLNFNGGTLVANQNITWANTNGLITAYNGGATLDDGGFALTVSQAIAAPTGYGVTALPTISPTAGYVGSPYVFLSGGSGTNAAGVADYDPATGLVTGIRLTNPGTGYQSGDAVTVWLRTASGSTSVGAATLGQNVGGGLTKLGSGTLSLTGANTYTGATAINAGILSAGVADVAGTSGALGNGGSIAFGGGTLRYTAASAGSDYSSRIRNSGSAIAIDTNAQSVTYTGVIDNTNTGGLALNDSNATKGMLTLSNANTFSGTTTVTSGTLRLSNSLALQNSVLGSGGTSLIFDSAVSSRAFTVAGLAGATNLALIDSSTNAIALSVGNGNVSSSYSGALSGSGSLVKIGTGTLTLSGNNSHSGGTTISAGTLRMGSATALGASTGSLSVNGGTLDMNGFSEAIGALSGSSGAVITSSGAATLTGSSSAPSQYDGIISGAVALTKQGAGTLTLGGANTYSGTTTISGGTLALGGGGSINATSSRLVISNAASLRIGSGATVTTSGIMSVTGTGAILLESGGSLVSTQAGGSVQFVPDAGAGNNTRGSLASTGAVGTSGTMTATGSYLRPAGVNNTNYTFTFDNVIVSATGASFEVGRGGSGNTVTLANGARVTALNSTLSIDATSYTLNVNGGSTLAMQNSGNLTLRAGNGGSNTSLNINSGTVSGVGTFSFGGAADSVVSITNGGLFSTNANSTISATNALVSISGTGSHWNMNGKSLTLGGSGIESNAVRLSNGGQLSTGSLSIATGGNALEFDGGILASGSTGTLLSGAGTVRIKSGGATVNTGSFSSTISALLSEDASSTGGGLIKLGSGSLTLGAANTFAGTTSVTAGTLALGHTNALQFSTLDTGAAGSQTVTFTASGTNTYALGGLAGSDDLAIGANSISVGGNNASTTFGGSLGGTGGLFKVGNGMLALSGNNSHFGGTTISAGALRMGSATALGASTGALVVNGGTLDMNGFSGSVGTFSGSSGATVTSQSAATLTASSAATSEYAGLLSGAIAFTKQGSGLLTFSGSNSYGGGTWINAGTLRAGNASAFGTGVITLASGATLDLNSFSIANTITNNGGTITGAASFSGTTTLTSGTSSLANIGGTVEIDASAVANLSGTIDAEVIVQAGGRGRALGQIKKNVTVNGGAHFDILNDATIDDAASFSFANNGLIHIDRVDALTVSKVISGTGGLLKSGNSRVKLTGHNTFTGVTQVAAGALIVNGTLAGDVVVDSGATLGGSGRLGDMLSGAGTISVGNSPGIGTAGSVDPSAGTDWVFEITGLAPTWNAGSSPSVNDVLRLTDATPFASSLGLGNVVDVLFNLGSMPLEQGSYLGGFFIDNETFNLAGALTGGTFRYWVAGTYGSDASKWQDFNVGANGTPITYSLLSAYDSSLSGSYTVTQQTVNFGSADVTGAVTQFVIIPEPSTIVFAGIGAAMAGYSLWKRRRFAEILRK